jgi:hypothetical protein
MAAGHANHWVGVRTTVDVKRLATDPRLRLEINSVVALTLNLDPEEAFR